LFERLRPERKKKHLFNVLKLKMEKYNINALSFAIFLIINSVNEKAKAKQRQK